MNILNSRKYKLTYRDRKQVSSFLGTRTKRKMDYKETQGNVGVVCYLDFGDGFTSIYIHIHSTGAIRHMHNICIMENRLITASQETQKRALESKLVVSYFLLWETTRTALNSYEGYRTLQSNMSATSHVCLFKFKFKCIKIKFKIQFLCHTSHISNVK